MKPSDRISEIKMEMIRESNVLYTSRLPEETEQLIEKKALLAYLDEEYEKKQKED